MIPADTIDVLSAIAAYDQRTIGKADVEAWHMALADLDRDLAMEAVVIHHKTSTERCKPAHVRSIAGGIRRRRVEAEHARRVADDTRPPALMHGSGFDLNADGHPVRDAYAVDGAINLPCPKCQAQPGHWCLNRDTGSPTRMPHIARLKAAHIAAGRPKGRQL